MRSFSFHHRHVLLAVTAALGVMSTAGSPCCGGNTYTPMGTKPYLVDGGAAPLPPGPLSGEQCHRICNPSKRGTGFYECEAVSATEVSCTHVTNVCDQPSGRRPPGHRDSVPRGTTVQGAFFAGLAELEDASVDAFAIVAAELERFGAPRALIDEALRAEDDERRHARVVGSLARRRGGRPRKRVAASHRHRSLYAFARDNAVEGCTRETFGALLAAHQAHHAEDADVRTAMRSIAPDEIRHAALARAIHDWAMDRLRPHDRHRVARAQRRARERLAFDPPAHVGLPDRETMKAMAGVLFNP